VSRPSETITGIVGSIVGAVLVLLGEFGDIEVSTNATAAIIVIVSWIAAGVTWYVARKQRSGELGSSRDGTVNQ
jgi:hypothetical protein